ncbi:MAG: putative sulfate exporter family transporter [Alistipes sp.]|nr:putative sulfate exporter family transporter [Alistipes sp.]MBQ8775088.1 putative sulfate exporter family transporter [Alistipes sp.]
MKKYLTEDWIVTFLSIPLLIIAGLATFLPNNGPKVPSHLDSLEAWANIGVFFVIALVVLYLGNLILKRPMKGLIPSFVVIFAIAVLAQWIAKIPAVKFYGFEAVFFSVIFGLIIRNLFHIPEWLKPAIQGEFFIKIGVVCLGATVLFRDVMKSGAAGLIQAVIVVGIVWFFAYLLARKFKVERATAMTLASGCSICGVSACITAAGVAGTDKKQLSYIISLVLIIVVPMIYLMPWLAKMIVPLFTEDPIIQQEIMGAWIGGTIDTTSGVVASSEMAGDLANTTAVIVKATQNVLIGVVAFFIALYLSARGEGKTGAPSLGIVWEKFPKFILGFVVASAVFSLLQAYGVFPDAAESKLAETTLAKTFSTFFFSLAFVCIGMDTRLKDIISKENRNALYAFLGAQTFNICVTCLVAWLMFGIVKPALEGDKSEPVVEAVEEVAEATEATIAVEPAATESTVEVVDFEVLTPAE